MPVLFSFGGLPATGKTSIARELARQCQAVHLRLDTIEAEIVQRSSLSHPVGPVGYCVAYGVAADQLRIGLDVVADTVNPVSLTRSAWAGVASEHDARLVEVEVICSDPEEHRRRAESRSMGIPGLEPPSWASIVSREYQPWVGDHLIIDTARTSVAEAVARIRAVTGDG